MCSLGLLVYYRVRACMRACVRACMHDVCVCARACLRGCVNIFTSGWSLGKNDLDAVIKLPLSTLDIGNLDPLSVILFTPFS